MATKQEIVPLTGLRGIAALLVVANHYFWWCSPYDPRTAPKSIALLFTTADYGMTLFFVLSGFVITYNYLDLDWRQSPLRSFASFMWRRFSRLYPAMLVFCLLIMQTNNWRGLLGSSFASWTAAHFLAVQSWLPFKQNETLQADGNFHIVWSISTEFGMYLMFAIAAIALARFRNALSIVVGVMAAYTATLIFLALGDDFFVWLASTHILDAGQPATGKEINGWLFYTSPYYRICEFVVGAAAAYAILRYRSWVDDRKTILSRLALAGILLIVPLHLIVYGDVIAWGPKFIFFRMTLALIFGVLILNATSEDSAINRALSARLLVMIGACSLSLYLFHPFVVHTIMANSSDVPFEFNLLPKFIRAFAMAVAFAIIFAYGMYHLVELPAQRLLRRLSVARPVVD